MFDEPPPPEDAGESFSDWLQQIGLGHCAPVLLEQGINFDIASELTEQDLRECGVVRLGDRKRFVREIRLRGTAQAARGKESASQPARDTAGERRQLTVMFCDLVDYTGLTQRHDGELVNGMIDAYRRACALVIQRYEGHVAQYLADGLMVYFGWPTAHADHAERCVRAALEIRQEVKAVAFLEPLTVHIGIASGSVVVGDASPDADGGDRLAIGETPNLASRLADLAEGGEILIDPTTLRLVGQLFTVTDAGVHALKGIVTPLQTWRVDGVCENPWRFGAAHGHSTLTTLVGRDGEIDLLHQHWTWAHNGEGQIVMLCGEPGIGKSRLAQALHERIRNEEHFALYYQCSSYRQNSALYPIQQQLEFAARFAREDSPEQKLDKLEAILAGADGERKEAAALLAPLLSLPTTRYAPMRLSPQRQKEKLLESLIAQVSALARIKPVLILFEDAHWIDPTSQELIDLLIPELRAVRVMLVITHRPQYEPRSSGYPHVFRMDLTGLPPRLGTELVSEVALGKPLPESLLRQIVARADGVPLYIEELTKSVLESQLVEEQRDRYTLAEPLRALAIPTTLNASLVERLGRRASVRELAQIGACIGREFSYELLAAVAPYAGGELDEELEHLTATGLVFRRGAPPDALYTFKHALVQDAAYDSLLHSKRAHLHGQIARALAARFAERVAREPEILAHHRELAGNFAEAIPEWRKAGEAALARVALQEAVAYLEKGLAALERLPDASDRDRLEVTLRVPLHAARLRWHGWAAPDVEANATALLTVAERGTDRQGLLIGLWGSWVSAITQGRIAEALELAERIVERGTQTDDPDLDILGQRALVSSRFYLGDLHDADRHAAKALLLYDPRLARHWMEMTGSDVRTAVGVFWCQCLWILGYPDRAVAVSNQKDADALQLGNPFDNGWARTWGAYVFEFRREPDRLLERVEAAERIGREQSLPVIGGALAPISRGLAMLRRGRFADAISMLQSGMAGWNESGGHLHEPYMKSALAEAFAHQGDIDTAFRLIEEGIEQVNRPGWGEKVWLPELLRMKAWLFTLRGRNEDAESQLRASIACAREQEARSWELRSATMLSELLAARGEVVEARNVLGPIYSWFTEGFESHDLKAARAVLDRLSLAFGGQTVRTET